MLIKNKAIILCGVIALISGTPDISHARWSSSSSSSRSYSPKTYSTRSITKSTYSGFGSKSYQNQKTAAPVSLNNTKSDNIFSKQSRKDQTVKDYTNWKNKSYVPISKPSQTASSNSSTNSTVVNKTYVTKNYNYGGHSYILPSYYAPLHPSYGNISSFFLGMLLAKATEPSYYNWAYAHYNDPSYIQWHREMEAQAQTNSNLQAQLSALDAKVEYLKISNDDPNKLVKADPSLESGQDIKSFPVTDNPQKSDNSSFWKWAARITSVLLLVGIFVIVFI